MKGSKVLEMAPRMENPQTPKNRQRALARAIAASAPVFAGLAALPFFSGNPLSGAWALTLVGVFLAIGAAVVAGMFSGRARKMDKLLSTEALLCRWALDDNMLKAYVALQEDESRAKNKALMWVVGGLFTLVTVIFLFALEAGERGGFTLIMGTILMLVFGASRFFPWYYRRRNLKADRQILIGSRYVYINGYFHSWDTPLSGLTKVRVIHSPFHGLHLTYWYTDRTLRNTHALKIPAPAGLDLNPLVKALRGANAFNAPESDS